MNSDILEFRAGFYGVELVVIVFYMIFAAFDSILNELVDLFQEYDNDNRSEWMTC